MTTQPTFANDTVDPATVANSAVWDRLWRHQPSADRDTVLLERELRSARWSLICQRVRQIFGSFSGLRTVELGSGRGDLSARMAIEGAEVTLVDTSQAALDQAQHRFDRLNQPVSLVKDDLFKFPKRSGSGFDIAVSSGVIEHFRGDDRTRTIQSHFDVLAPGGIAIISVPHARCLPYRVWKFYLELRGWWPYGMELPYTGFEMRRRARRAGFNKCETRSLGFLQSVGGHWYQTLFGSRPSWTDRSSPLDSFMGLTLLLIAQRDGQPRVVDVHPKPLASDGVLQGEDGSTSGSQTGASLK